MLRLRINIWTPLTLLFVYIYGLFMIRPIFSGGDPAWHLAAGDYIRKNGIPLSDPWAFTSGGVPWYNLSWGFDVFISYWHDLFGFGGLYLLMPLILTFVIYICFIHCRERGVSVQTTSLTCILAGAALSTSTLLRPQLVTFLLIAILHYFLHRDGAGKCKGKEVWFIFPALTLIWSNMHGGVIALFIVAGCYSLQYLINKDIKRIYRCSIIGAICFCTVLMTPFGTEIFYGMNVSIMSVMNGHIVEWLPMVPFEIFEQGAFFCLFLFVTNFRNPEIPLADRLVTGLWLLFTLRSRRHFPLFVILSVPYVAMSLDKFGVGSWLYKEVSSRLQTKRVGPGYMMALGVVAFAVILSSLYLNIVPQNIYTKQNKALGQAVEYIAEKYPNSNVFNRFNDGGQIIYMANGRFKMAIDGRIDTAYSSEYMQEYYEKIDSVRDGWMESIKKYNPQIFLVPEDSKMTEALKKYPDEWVFEKEFKADEETYYVIVNKGWTLQHQKNE